MRDNEFVMFDLDDTLCHLGSAFADFLSVEYNHPEWKGSVSKWKNYPHIGEYYPGIDIHEAFLKFEESGEMSKLKPTMIANMARSLSNAGAKIHVVTARAWMNQPKYITNDWLYRNDIPSDMITIVGLQESKKDVIQRSIEAGRKYIGVFEDSPKHLSDIVSLGVLSSACIVDQPWNRNGEILQEVKHTRVFPNGKIIEF